MPAKLAANAVGKEHDSCRENLISVPLAKIKTTEHFRLRHDFINIDPLAEDIRARGQLCPLFVKPIPGNGGYELISGHRRLAALRMNRAADAMVRVFPRISSDEALRLAVAENVQREDLTHLEKAHLCMKLQEQGKSLVEIAKLVFPSVAAREGNRNVSNYLAVARTDPKIQEALAHDGICFSVAVLLAESLKSRKANDSLAHGNMGSFLERISREDMSVREVKALLEAPCPEDFEKPSMRRRGASSPFVWQEGKRGSWTFRVNFDPAKLGDNPSKLEQIEAEILKALGKVREHLRARPA